MRAAGATACSKEVGRTAGIVKRIWIKEVRGTQRHTSRPELSFVQMFFRINIPNSACYGSGKENLLGRWNCYYKMTVEMTKVEFQRC